LIITADLIGDPSALLVHHVAPEGRGGSPLFEMAMRQLASSQIEFPFGKTRCVLPSPHVQFNEADRRRRPDGRIAPL
jgi:hypothetical protein